MKSFSFSHEAWEDILYWAQNDHKKLKKIIILIDEIRKTPFNGTGKPEPLKFKLSGYWSRKIDEKERIVYRVETEKIIIATCKSHY
jgi:toxin YoeB